MEFLGIGPSELLFIIIIALIVLGPKDMQKAGRTAGKWMRKIITSDGWKLFQQTSREIQTLPNRLMREAVLDELKDLQKNLNQPLDSNSRLSQPSPAGGTQPNQASLSDTNPPSKSENKILSLSPHASLSAPIDFANEAKDA